MDALTMLIEELTATDNPAFTDEQMEFITNKADSIRELLDWNGSFQGHDLISVDKLMNNLDSLSIRTIDDTTYVGLEDLVDLVTTMPKADDPIMELDPLDYTE